MPRFPGDSENSEPGHLSHDLWTLGSFRESSPLTISSVQPSVYEGGPPSGSGVGGKGQVLSRPNRSGLPPKHSFRVSFCYFFFHKVHYILSTII